MATPKFIGNCDFCGKSFSKSGIPRHLTTCREKSGVGDRVPGYHLAVEGLGLQEYWLQLDVAANLTLWELDAYLRDTWLECCYHLSLFRINGNLHFREDPGRFAHMNDRGMEIALGQVLHPGMRFSHEYDFGTTTTLALRVVSEGEVAAGQQRIRLLARNDPPALFCSRCEAAATGICPECVWNYGEWEGLFCDKCKVGHVITGHSWLDELPPVVNSPRAGMCGYTGLDSPK